MSVSPLSSAVPPTTAKFKEKVDEIVGIDVAIPDRLAAFMKGTKQSVPMTKDFADFKKYLLTQ